MSFFKKLFNKHMKLEMFGVATLALVIMFSILLTSIGVKSYNDKHQKLSNKVIYTPTFETTRTKTTGTVEGVYTNSDKTKAMILLHFDHTERISLDANNYTVFITGYDQNSKREIPYEGKPVGSTWMFGSTGYMGIYLVDTAGFPQQLSLITIKNNKEMKYVDGSDIDQNALPDQQYAQYDMADIFVNLGASETTYCECLNADKLSVQAFYEECIVRTREQEIRAELASELKAMKADIVNISEYTSRLENAGILVNDAYSCIVGDYICNADGQCVASMNPDTALTRVTDDETLYLSSTHTLAGGVDFNWQDGCIKDGYLDTLRGNQSMQAYIAELTAKPDESDDKSYNDKWYYAENGIEFSYSRTQFSQVDADIQNNITSLIGCWDNYYREKSKYEKDTLIQLLVLEYEVRNVENNYTVNSSEKAVIIQ